MEYPKVLQSVEHYADKPYHSGGHLFQRVSVAFELSVFEISRHPKWEMCSKYMVELERFLAVTNFGALDELVNKPDILKFAASFGCERVNTAEPPVI